MALISTLRVGVDLHVRQTTYAGAWAKSTGGLIHEQEGIIAAILQEY